MPISASIGDYLKAIWRLSDTEPVATTTIAAQLNVSAPSVSAMFIRLQERGFVTYERYKGVRLTAQGEREALKLLRRHRLIETFLLAQLGYSWDEVHEEAERLEHAVSERFTERLAALLSHPTHDPHGDPIPEANGTLPHTPGTPLADVEVGGTLRVHGFRSRRPTCSPLSPSSASSRDGRFAC